VNGLLGESRLIKRQESKFQIECVQDTLLYLVEAVKAGYLAYVSHLYLYLASFDDAWSGWLFKYL